MKKQTARQLIDEIASNNEQTNEAEAILQRLEKFTFETGNEVLKSACKELEGIANASRHLNRMLFKEFNQIVRIENRKLAKP